MGVLEKLMSIVAPHECLVCGNEGALLCNWCFMDGCPSVLPRCYKCYASTPNSEVCAKCRAKSPLKHVWVRSDYEGLAKQLIHNFKFERMQAAAKPIAAYMQEALPYLENVLCVPIPTASSRLRQRGYDHTKLIAKHLVSKKGLRYEALLERLGQSRQVGTKRKQRVLQLQEAFRVIRLELVKDAHILLVDDVVTSGATLEETARVLKQAGAKTVDAAVFAQKQ